ncbi:MAG: PIG-L deacetylase family protein [Pseudomonadota bacterium]
MKVLVVAAHPDDEVLGCGATIRRLSEEGHQVQVCIFGEGATSRHTKREQAVEEETRTLSIQAVEAGRILGATSVLCFGLPDNRFDSLDLLDVVKRVESLLDEFSPSLVFTHHPGDLNVDHRVLFQATLTACRPDPGASVKELLCFEIPSSTEWAFQRIEPIFRPAVFYDVHTTLDKKLDAMAIYSRESRAFPHPRSPEALTAVARRWGSVVGVEAAEAFEVIRTLR